MSEEADQQQVAQDCNSESQNPSPEGHGAPFCLCCSSNTVQTNAENEAEDGGGFLASLADAAGDVYEAVADAVEAVTDKVEDAIDAVRDGLVDALDLDDKFKSLADRTLDDIAPKAGEKVVSDALAGGFIPGFKKLDDLTSRDLDSEAREACANKILSFRTRIHDFCEDVVEYLKEGSDMLGSVLKCLHKVVSWILRACKEGVQMAVELIKKVIPDCCESCCLNCMSLGQKITDFVTTTFNKLVNMVEDFIQECMVAMGFPAWLVEKVDFNGDNANPDNARDDDETEKEKMQKNKGQKAPQQETMGDVHPCSAMVPEDETERGPDTL